MSLCQFVPTVKGGGGAGLVSWVGGSVIFVNENENEKIMKTKTKLKRKNKKRNKKTKTKKSKTKTIITLTTVPGRRHCGDCMPETRMPVFRF